jgi:hypothetical protein
VRFSVVGREKSWSMTGSLTLARIPLL